MAKPKNSQAHEKVPIAEIASALTAFNGDFNLAAVRLSKTYPNTTEEYLRGRMRDSPQLKSLYNKRSKANVPDDVEIATRSGEGTPTSKVVENNPMLAGEIAGQDMALLSQGLKAAGLSDSTLEKLEVLGKFQVSGGRLIATTLELTNRMAVISTAQLFERIQLIEKKMSLCEACETEDSKAEWAGWVRLANQCQDLLLKSQDRSIQGMQALVKIQAIINGKNGKGKGGSKPGLTAVNQAPAAARA